MVIGLAALLVACGGQTPKPPAPVNRFGSDIFGIAAGGDLQNETRATAMRDLQLDRAAGARWVRVDVNWAQIQADGPHSFDWLALDAVVDYARGLGMRVLGTILYTPPWARPPGDPARWGPRPGTYATFAGEVARHLQGRVSDLEIWNEENTRAFWLPEPSAAAYTALLRAADTAIRRVEPHDVVITGGTAPAENAPGMINPVTFLQRIYAHGGKGFFDAVGDHPYCWPAYPGTVRAGNAWYEMYGTTPSLRSVMTAHGDAAKAIWATEFGAPTGGPPGSYVSESTQARMIGQAYRLFASYRWAGPLFLYQGRDAGDSESTDQDWFGFLLENFTPKPAYDVYRRLAASL